MAACAGSSDRHYENSYKDFNPVNSNFIKRQNDSYEITDEFKTRIRQKVESLLNIIRSNQKDVVSAGTSVYTGTAGVAMTFLFSSKRINKDDLQIAKVLIEGASKTAHKSRFNFLNGKTGTLILSFLIHQSSESKDRLSRGLEEIWELVRNPMSDVPDELLYGRIGLLFSQLFMIKNKMHEVFCESEIKNLIKVILSSGQLLAQREGSKAPLKYKWHEKNYYGAAHGTAGILYVLLQAKEYINTEDMNNFIKPTIDNLLEQRFSSGNLLSSEGSPSDRLVQWCHGAPGAVQLFCLAFEVFKDKRYFTAAVQCGEVIWNRGLLRKGCGLCHGTAGNAYGFLSLYQLLKTQAEELEAAKHLHRACAFADWCFDFEKHQERHADRYYSLYEGLSGTAYFLMDLLEPAKAAFPGYTVQSL